MQNKIKIEILKKIKPNKKEELVIESKVKKFIEKLTTSKNKLKINCDFFIGGSYGKGTYLKKDFDVDIFCRFDNPKNISSELEKILEDSSNKISKQKGSRDYFQVKEKGISFEIIPIKKIKKISDAENTTDHSPLHVEFVKSAIKKNKKISDEIRLAKQFFKANNLYGAESYINGFSGHIIDLLIIHYGNFENLLKEISMWKSNTIIDVANLYENEKELLSKIEKDKHSSLIIVDPILKTRNAARALNIQNYSLAILIAQEKTNNVSGKDFTIRNISSKQKLQNAKKFAKENNLKLISYTISLTSQIQSNDIVGSKLLKLHGRLENYFGNLDFKIFKSKFNISFNEGICQFFYFFEKTELPLIKKIMGPKVDMKSEIAKFLKNKKIHFVKEDRVYAYEKRKIVKIQNCTKMNKKDFENLLGKKVEFISKIKIE